MAEENCHLPISASHFEAVEYVTYLGEGSRREIAMILQVWRSEPQEVVACFAKKRLKMKNRILKGQRLGG